MGEASREPAHRLVWRNTLYLVGAQVLVLPLSVITNLLVARYLGPADFGQLYLATTFAALAFLVVESGQSGALAGLVAAQRPRAGEFLGSSLAWRALLVPPATLALLGIAAALGYPRSLLVAISLVVLASAFGTLSSACQDTLRGHERTDIGALTFVAWKLLVVAATVPVLLLGGGLVPLLWAQAGCAAVGALAMLRLLRAIELPRLAATAAATRELLAHGWPFLALSLVLALQENVDAAFLSRLASPEAVGWHAAARKLIGLLVFPGSALVSALYPTLCRLRQQEPARMADTASRALRMTVLLAVPLAAGCLLFPGLGIQIFGSAGYGPATANLRLMAPFLLCVYASMPIGSLLMASGRQRAWIALQLLSVALCALLDAWLVPLCQAHYANGGLGACASMAITEIVVVAGGLWLAPRALLDRKLLRNVACALVGGLAMALVALVLRNLSPWLVAPLALAAYALVQVLLGTVSRNVLSEARALLRPAR
jgi:O-antigen/teichoic acid export membrane protein